MSFWLRITLTWLLALAVPLQGHAAQSRFMCGPDHGGSGSHASAVQALHAAADPHAARADDHEPASDAGHADHAGHAQLTEHTGHTEHVKQAEHGQCSVCASCSGALALTSAVRVFEASPAPTHYRAEAQTPSPGTIPDGLERPPRKPLA